MNKNLKNRKDWVFEKKEKHSELFLLYFVVKRNAKNNNITQC